MRDYPLCRQYFHSQVFCLYTPQHNNTFDNFHGAVPPNLLHHSPFTPNTCFRNSINKMSSPDAFEHLDTAGAVASGAHIAPVMTSSGGGEDGDSRARAQSSALVVAKTATTSTCGPFENQPVLCYASSYVTPAASTTCASTRRCRRTTGASAPRSTFGCTSGE